MHAMIEYTEVKRIRQHLRYYAHEGREDGRCAGCEDTEHHPVIVSWHNEKPFKDRQRFLVLEIDETGVPPLYVIATDNGDDYGGHTYTDVLKQEVDYFIRNTDKPPPGERSSRTLTISVDQEMSYAWEYVSKKSDRAQQKSVSDETNAVPPG